MVCFSTFDSDRNNRHCTNVTYKDDLFNYNKPEEKDYDNHCFTKDETETGKVK